MKRILSMLLAVVMVISMFPVVASAEEEAVWGKEYFLNPDKFSMEFTYKATADGTVTISSGAEGIVAMMEGVDPAWTLENIPVTANQELKVEFCLTDDSVFAEDGNAYFTPNFNFLPAAVKGESAEDPIDLSNELAVGVGIMEKSYTVEVPAGKTYYYQAVIYGMGFMMTINDGDATAVPFRTPFTWSIKNEGDTAAEYTIKVFMPAGSMDNPAKLSTSEEEQYENPNVATIAEGGKPYYFVWTAPEDGTLIIEMPKYQAWTYRIYRDYMPEAEISTDSEYVDDPYYLDVLADETIMLEVLTLDVNNINHIPAGKLKVYASFEAVPGSKNNPTNLTEYITWNEAQNEATVTWTVWAGETEYVGLIYSDMELYINGEYQGITTGSMYTPQAIELTAGEEDTEFVLFLTYPDGTYEKPEAIDGLPFESKKSLEAEESYYYSWTAFEDTTLGLDVTEGANIIAEVITDGIPVTYYLAEDQWSEDWEFLGWDVAENLTLNILEDQTVKIEVSALYDWVKYESPAVEYTLTAKALIATEDSPMDLTDDLLNEEDYTAYVWIPGGETYYFMSYGLSGKQMTINDDEPFVCTTMYPMMPYYWSITNKNDYETQYTIVVAIPAGTQENPAQAKLGDNVAVIEAGSQGYFWSYEAEFTGELKVGIASTAAGWTYQVNNMTTYVYGDTQWSDSDPVVNPAVISVNEGDEITIIVNTYDPKDEWNAPAGTITLKLEAPSVAVIGDEGYMTVEDALAAAEKTSATVTLVDDVKAGTVQVYPGVTLDLNGKKLTADFVSVFKGGNIVDSSEANSGVLVADEDAIILTKSNSDLPIWNDEGYIFVNVSKFNAAISQGSYCFQPFFESAAHQYLNKGAAFTGVEIALRLTWKEGNTRVKKDFVYMDEFVQTYVNSYNVVDGVAKYGKMFMASVQDGGVEELAVQVVLVSNTGVEVVMPNGWNG